MKEYREYQDTEYDWLPKVPKHWLRRSIRSITELCDERNGASTDLELLSVYREYGVIKKSSRDDNHNVASTDLSNYKHVRTNNLVMNKMKMWQGSLGVSEFEGIVSPAYIVCKFTYPANYKYFHYLLRSPKFKTQYNRISYGIRVGQWDMRYNDLKNTNIYIPTKPEQDQIVKFLDSKITKIDKFIEGKKREIKLLKELKQAEINRAITKGLNSDAEMKDSGIDWLGEIPEHWDKRYLSQVASEQKISNKGMVSDNLLSLSYGRIVNKNIKNTDGLLPASFETYQVVRYGNIILRLTDLQNDHKSLRTGLVTQDGIITSAYTCLTTKEGVSAEYLQLLLHSFDLCKVFYGMGGGLRQSIGFTEIRRMQILVPPLPEQENIVKYIDEFAKKVDKTISRYFREIEFCSEYKTSIISEVVTGKIDVRDVKINEKQLVTTN